MKEHQDREKEEWNDQMDSFSQLKLIFWLKFLWISQILATDYFILFRRFKKSAETNYNYYQIGSTVF